jgi:hypothetical protein
MTEEGILTVCHVIDRVEFICAITVKWILRSSYEKGTVAVEALFALVVLILSKNSFSFFHASDKGLLRVNRGRTNIPVLRIDAHIQVHFL